MSHKFQLTWGGYFCSACGLSKTKAENVPCIPKEFKRDPKFTPRCKHKEGRRCWICANCAVCCTCG